MTTVNVLCGVGSVTSASLIFFGHNVEALGVAFLTSCLMILVAVYAHMVRS